MERRFEKPVADANYSLSLKETEKEENGNTYLITVSTRLNAVTFEIHYRNWSWNKSKSPRKNNKYRYHKSQITE